MLLGVQVDDELLVDVFGNVGTEGDIQELAAECLCIELQPGVLGCTCDSSRDDLEVLAPFAYGDDVTGLYGCGRNVADGTVECDVTMADELACGCPRGSDAKTVYHVVETALKEEDEVLTLLAAHAGSLVVCVVELTLEHTIHIFDFLLLFQLDTILLALLALCSESVLSRRIVSLFKIFVCTEDGFAELTGDLGGRSCISCHSFLSLNVKLYDGLSDGNHCEA